MKTLKNINLIFSPFFYLYSLKNISKSSILALLLAFTFVPSSLSAACSASETCANIGDVTPQNEGNTGTTTFSFPITITKNHEAVTLNFRVNHIGTDNSDLTLATTSPITLGKNINSAFIVVNVNGDTNIEPNEVFQVELTSYSGDLTKIDDAIGESTILNDDFPPSASISDANITEGDSGTSTLNFTVTLSKAAPLGGVTLNYTTSDGTATTADSDYVAAAGILTIAQGATSGTISVTVNGDLYLENESNEIFTITLSNPTNATISNATATGTIINDDFAPVANAGSDQTILIGQNFTLDASASTDSDGTITNYSWTDGTTTWVGAINTIIGVLPVGTYTYTLTVTDNDGFIDTDTVTITVVSALTPTVSIAGASILEGNSGTTTALNFTVSLSSAAPAGGVSVNYNTSNITASAGVDYTATSGTLTIPAGNNTGTISVTIIGDDIAETDETFSVTLSNPLNATLGTSTGTGVILNDDSSAGCSNFTPEFTLNIDGTEDDVKGLSGGPYGFTGSTDNRFWEFNATAAAGEDINGTLRINIYASNFNEICSIKFLDENCNTLQSWNNTKGQEFGYFIDTDSVYYVEIDDLCSNNPQVIVALLWYPDVNGTDGEYGFAYNEPAIFKGTDYTPTGNIFDTTKDFVTTKIVNEEHDITVSIVKDDNTLFTNYSGSFRFDLVDATDYGTLTCSQLPRLKYNGILGFKNNDNGVITTGDNTTEHGPSLIYDEAVKNVKYRMTYLVNTGDNSGIINYEDLILFNGCVGNKQSCLWGVLTSMAASGQDPFLPDYTIADVCGLYCDPGSGAFGTGNNQISQQCADCVFGPGYSDCTDSFAIRPDTFDANITSGDALTAGAPESLSFKALDGGATPAATVNYNETENTSFAVDINISDATKVCQNEVIGMTPNVDFTDGLDEGDFIFDDIGDVNMTIHEINGTEFALIDAYDTNDSQRMIGEFNVNFRIIPDHFNIDANLTDHNTDHNFTYLHDINQYDLDDNYSMGGKLTIDIKAMGADDNVTRNYMETCYAEDTNLTLVINSTDITYPGTIQPLTQFLYYNPVEDNGTADSGEGNYTLPSLTNITSLPIENIEATFPADAPDGNGTTFIEYRLNFDRKIHLVVNPFEVNLNNVDIVETNVGTPPVTGTTGALTNQSATYQYARSRSSKFFYEDINTQNVNTPILVDVYCDLSFTACDNLSIDTVNAQINEVDWWLSLGHDRTNNDGNITLMESPLVPPEGASADWSVTPTVNILTNATDPNIVVDRGTNPILPLTVEIELDRTNTTDTNHWLIHNEETDDIVQASPSPFYKVRFIGTSGWAGHGDTGHVVDSNTSIKKHRRLGW